MRGKFFKILFAGMILFCLTLSAFADGSAVLQLNMDYEIEKIEKVLYISYIEDSSFCWYNGSAACTTDLDDVTCDYTSSKTFEVTFGDSYDLSNISTLSTITITSTDGSILLTKDDVEYTSLTFDISSMNVTPSPTPTPTPTPEPKAKIGEKGYQSLSEAVNEAVDGSEIILLSDVSESVVINKGITLDLNGHTLTCSGEKAFDVQTGDATIIKNGSIVCPEGIGIYISGTLSVSGLNISANCCIASPNNALTVTDGYYSGETIASGSVYFKGGFMNRVTDCLPDCYVCVSRNELGEQVTDDYLYKVIPRFIDENGNALESDLSSLASGNVPFRLNYQLEASDTECTLKTQMNLNGWPLSVKYMYVSQDGKIIDSCSGGAYGGRGILCVTGEGGDCLKVNNIIPGNTDFIPIYDSTSGGYRFYRQYMAVAIEEISSDETDYIYVMHKFHLYNPEGYGLLTGSHKLNLEITVTLSAPEKESRQFTYSAGGDLCNYSNEGVGQSGCSYIRLKNYGGYSGGTIGYSVIMSYAGASTTFTGTDNSILNGEGQNGNEKIYSA